MVNEAYILRFRNQQRNYIYNIYRSSPFGRVCPNTNIHRPLSPHPTIHKPQLTPPYVSNLPSVTIDSFFHPNKPGGYDEGIPDPYHQVGDPFLMGPSLPGRGSLFQQIRGRGKFPSDEGARFPRQRHDLPEMPCLYYVTVCCRLISASLVRFCK